MIEYDDLLRASWRAGGRTLATGIDCWGIILIARERMGLAPTPDPFTMEDEPDVTRQFCDAVLEEFAGTWVEVFTHRAPNPGDIAALPSFHGDGTHAAVCIGKGPNGHRMALHMTKNGGVCLPWTRIVRHIGALYRAKADAGNA